MFHRDEVDEMLKCDNISRCESIEDIYQVSRKAIGVLVMDEEQRDRGAIETVWHLMMISEMPTTPCLRTSSATEKALCKGVFSGMICSSLQHAH